MVRRRKGGAHRAALCLAALLPWVACAKHDEGDNAGGGKAAVSSSVSAASTEKGMLSDKALRNLVERSYQYVAMYNVNNKFAKKQGGWNTCAADTRLKDHTMQDIARPNNDTLYSGCMLDLRKEPMIVEFPAFDSDYASLMVTAYDHYVNGWLHAWVTSRSQ